ncbi:MAG: CapA family protein [Gemmatimonadota bacterium]
MTITIALAGDAMLGRGVAAQLATAGPDGLVSDQVREYLTAADLAVLNLECCISERGRPWEGAGKRFHFRAPPAAASALAGLGVSCVTLANNHALDFGYAALSDTCERLAEAGIAAAGAGADLAQARAPALVEAGGLRVAVVSVTDQAPGWAAGPGEPGVAFADFAGGIPHWLTGEVASLAGDADVVLVMPHWGPNLASSPLPYLRSAARALVGAGATLVAGHSAHLFHGVSSRILFDLGDFIDDYPVDPALRNDLSLLFLVTLDAVGPVRVEAVPLKLEYARTGIATGADRDWIRGRLSAACTPFGTEVADSDGRFVLTAA